MALEPFFSLTPINPRVYTYDASKPDDPYALAAMDCYGVLALNHYPNRFTDQHSSDSLLLGYDPVDLSNQTFNPAFYQRNVVRFLFSGNNVSTENQYLLLFSLKGRGGIPTIQFFVETTMVRSEELSGEEQVAILMDVPGDQVTTQVYLRLASANYYSSFEIKGMDCYLL